MSSPPAEEPADCVIQSTVPKSATDENLKTELAKEGDSTSKTSLPSDLGIGGGRSNRPSQSDNTLAKSQSEIQVCATNSLSISQNSKNSLMTYSSSGTFYDHSKKKVDVRIAPKPVQPSNVKDTTDFRQMEQGLLQLLEDFHCGKLEGSNIYGESFLVGMSFCDMWILIIPKVRIRGLNKLDCEQVAAPVNKMSAGKVGFPAVYYRYQ
ncbi:coiled-coil domain-containing protein 28B [Caerostris extrusa]|uniref:Coiled-coil domain-containing protein 28B n=1 Tax=Caerostris extrusa TaxID=172846 RepID=A0AAV4QLV1_CAEEX|nr:coiled-coil domain-containing protein 28B [Caerostris extrusa]